MNVPPRPMKLRSRAAIVALLVVLFLALSLPVLYFSRTAYADIQRRIAFAAAEEHGTAYIAAFAPLLFDLQHIRALAHERPATGSFALAKQQLAADVGSIERANVIAEMPASTCGVSFAALAKRLKKLNANDSASTERAIGISTCLLVNYISTSKLAYDPDQSVQALSGLLAYDVPALIRRMGLAATQLDVRGPVYSRADIVRVSQALGALARVQNNLSSTIEEDEQHNDAGISARLTVPERAEERLEKAFEDQTIRQLVTPLIAPGAIRRSQRAANLVADSLRILTAQSLVEIGARIDAHRRQAEAEKSRVVVVTLAALALTLVILAIAVRLAQWRSAHEMLRMGRELEQRIARENAERALSVSEAQVRAVFEISQAGIGIIDSQLQFVEVNGAFAELIASHADVGAIVRTHAEEALRLQTPRTEVEFDIAASAGQQRFFSMSLVTINADERNLCVIVTVTDITDAKKLQLQMLDEISSDALTGLLNRKGFEEQLATIGPGTAVFFIDLDGFKPVNDRYGHAAGDAVLIAISQRLRQGLKERDVIARIGGDEFVALVQNVVDERLAATIAERMVTAVQLPIAVGTVTIGVTCSIGIAYDTSRSAEHTPAEMLHVADEAMYRAKSSRSGFVLHDLSTVA